tara:strand:+ start:2876 stop:4102 length:1227 start_codon:yes stop_codon:yes gene_type:complete
MKIKKCRICSSKKFSKLFSLGKQSFTGKFPNTRHHKIAKDYINLIICNKCKLVQLDRNFNPNFLYGKDYGYRTGINLTMSNHVKFVAKEAIKISKPKQKDYILDIASNDGTLLNNYGKKFITVGVDPLTNKYKKFYKKVNYKISNFFTFKNLKKYNLDKKYKIITALSMFYDLKDPNSFIKDIKKILHKDGIFILEHADLLSILKYSLFDTICHEHLEYYSSKIIIELMKKNNLRVFDIKNSKINGGSTRYLITHDNSKFKTKTERISKILKEEKKFKLEKKETFLRFFKRINFIKKKIMGLLNDIVSKKKTVHGYGASTKGNVLLQYFGINVKHLNYIAERNPLKYNKFTPGTYIKIISEKNSRQLKPHYYFVLPWHFKKEIVKRETKIRNLGTKLIFPLPKLKIIS